MEVGARVGDLQDHKDREALAMIAAGSEEAFVELYRRYAPTAMGLAFRILGQRMLAEDVLQEVFTSVWRTARSHDPSRGRVRTWLMTQIHHRAVDAVRREDSRRRRNVEAPIPVDDTAEVIEEMWLSARRNQVRAALAVLSPEQQQVISLGYFAGHTQRQIAQIVGVPLGTVKTRTMAAMHRLRAELSQGEP